MWMFLIFGFGLSVGSEGKLVVKSVFLKAVCFMSLGGVVWRESGYRVCPWYCALCLSIEVWSLLCWSIGSISVSSCRCCMLVSAVHPVAVLSAAFCIVCSLLVSVGLIIGP